MKKNFIETMSIAAVCLMLLIGCKSKPEHQFSESDVEKIAAWNKLLVSKPSLSRANDQPVCHTYADACTLKYKTAYEHAADVSAISAAYTYSEDFGSKNLSDWAQDIAKNTNATTIKMCFGIYTQAFVTAFPSAKPNRLAVFLYPVAADGTAAKYTSASTYTPPAANGCTQVITPAAAGDPTNPYNLAGVEP